MSEVVLEQVLSTALRTARVRARAAVQTCAVSSADREDLVQELVIAAWRAMAKFNPARASLSTFFERVIASRLASAIRTARRRPPMQPLDLAGADGVNTDEALFDLRLDIARLLEKLNPVDRRIAVTLMQFPPTEASRELQLSRSTVYRRIGTLRANFAPRALRPAHGNTDAAP